jgi:hypothetical protein
MAGAVAQQPRLLDLQSRLGDLLLNDALIGERPTERDARLRPLDHERQRTLGRAQRAHAVVNAPRSEPCLGSHEAAAFLADDVAHRHPGSVEQNLGVPVLVVTGG